MHKHNDAYYHVNKGSIRVKKQQGFAAIGAIILLVVVAVVVGGGYYVLSRNNSDDVAVEQSKPISVGDTTPNGKPENAVNEVNAQVNAELSKELSAMDSEDQKSEIDDATVAELEAAIDEKNL